MRELVRQVSHPVRSIVVTAAVAAAVLAGTQTSSIAAPVSGAQHAAGRVSAAQESQEFDGFGEGRSAFIALRAARNNAKAQATAAGFSSCSTIFEDSGFDPGFGTFVGESDILCTG